jgi:hypothetical protein
MLAQIGGLLIVSSCIAQIFCSSYNLFLYTFHSRDELLFQLFVHDILLFGKPRPPARPGGTFVGQTAASAKPAIASVATVRSADTAPSHCRQALATDASRDQRGAGEQLAVAIVTTFPAPKNRGA